MFGELLRGIHGDIAKGQVYTTTYYDWLITTHLGLSLDAYDCFHVPLGMCLNKLLQAACGLPAEQAQWPCGKLGARHGSNTTFVLYFHLDTRMCPLLFPGPRRVQKLKGKPSEWDIGPLSCALLRWPMSYL